MSGSVTAICSGRWFERVIEACIAAGLVGGRGFAVDASLIAADANKQRSIPGSEWSKTRDPATASRAVKEYLATLNDAAFGAATEVDPKFVSPSDPAAQWTGAMRGPAFFAYRQRQVSARGRHLCAGRLPLQPRQRHHTCPAGKTLTTSGTLVNDGATLLYRGSTLDCRTCQFKARCCPNTPARKIPRSLHERARDLARSLVGTAAFEQSRRERKRVEMLFAHLKRILKMGRLRLRGPKGAQDEFTLAASAQNLRRLAKLVAHPPPAAACVA
jgi:hypothetical protein